MKKILTILFVLFLFALGPFGYLNVLDTSVSLKYEVDHPRATITDPKILKDIDADEKYYSRRFYLFWTITILGPALGIGLTLYKIGLPTKSKL